MRSYRTTGLISVLALVSACAPKPAAPPDTAAVRSALNVQERKGVMALADKDTAALGAMFTQDATWIIQDASTFKGRAAIEKGANALFGSYDSLTIGALTIQGLVVISDTQALTFSHLGFSMTMKGQKKAVAYSNPFADYWVKGADGVWRVAYEINAGGVVPEASAPATRQ